MIDYIRKFDIELEKEHYYAGEILKGFIVIENTENIRVRGEIEILSKHVPYI